MTLLAWAIFKSENKKSWSCFLRHLLQAIPNLYSVTWIGNYDNGLDAADSVLGRNAV